MRGKKGPISLGQQKRIGYALETLKFTPSIRGSTRSFHRYTERKIKVLRYCKVLQRSRRINIPMSDQRTACNPNWPIRHRLSTIVRVHRITPDLIQLTQYCHRSTMSNVTLKHTPVRKRAPLTTRSSSFRCVSAAEHHTAELYSQNLQDKPRKHLPRSDLSWNACSRCQVFDKLFKKPGEDSSERSS